VIPGFLAITIPLILTPGVSTAVVLRNSLAGGTRAGVQTAVGMASASFCYGLLTAFGFALALRRWPWAWTAIQVGGALYLGRLAAQSLRRAATGRTPVLQAGRAAATGAEPDGFLRNAYEGFITNGLNPAIATFYVAIVPQFVPAGAPIVKTTLLLTAIHVALAATWHVTWAVAGGTLSHLLSGKRPRRTLEALAGITLAVLAIRLASR
jgi:threonine/homoserine/homoserine lactone efflux protein